MTTDLSPCCSYPLLHDIRLGKSYWFCPCCHQEMPLEVAKKSTTILQVEEDLNRYKFLLEQARDIILFFRLDGQIIEANNAAVKAYGYERQKLLSLKIQDIQDPQAQALLNEQLVKVDDQGILFDTIHVRKDGTTFPVEVSWQSTLIDNGIILLSIIRDITQRKLAESALEKQLVGERLIAGIAQNIRQSLNLKEILNTTVAEVRQFLQADRVIIHRFNPDWKGWAVVEAVAPGWPTMLGFTINDPFLIREKYIQEYQQSQVIAITDIKNSETNPALIEFLMGFQIKARLIVPILHGEQLWGLLIAHQCSATRQWQQSEIDLLSSLATQVAIAIHQSELYQQLQAANQELQRLAFVDGLTQLLNRRRFDEALVQEWKRLIREQAPLSLILCDIDFFKTYNDTYGHQAGDKCLQQVAKAISNAVKRPADLVARYGGEEFVVILPNTTRRGAVRVAEKIRARVAALKIAHTKSQISQYVTLSVGVATTVPDSASSTAALVTAADRALYQAKAQGRDRMILYDGGAEAQRSRGVLNQERNPESQIESADVLTGLKLS